MSDAISWVPGIATLILTVVFVGLASRPSGGYLSPVVVYGAIWLCTISAYLLPVIAYTSVSVQTWVAIAGSFVAFVSGCVLVEAWSRRGTRRPRPGDAGIPIDRKRLEFAIAVAALIGTLGLAGYIRAINQTVGLSHFLSSPHLIRQAQATDAYQQVFGIAKFLDYLNFAVFPLCVFYFVAFRGSAHRWILLLCVPATVAILLSLDRTQPFFVIVWSLATYLLLVGERHFTIRSLLVFGGAAAFLLVVFLGVASYVGKTSENNPALRAASKLPKELAPLLVPYSYLTASIPTLEKYIDVNPPGQYRGAFTLLPLTKIVSGYLGQHASPPEIGAFYDVPFPFNASTYLNVYYSDFGWPGLVLAPFVIGAAGTALYTRVSAAPSFLNIYSYALLCYAILLSVFANKLVSTFVWEMAAVGVLTSWYCGPRTGGKAPRHREISHSQGSEAS